MTSASNPYNVIGPDHFKWWHAASYDISCWLIWSYFVTLRKHKVYGKENIPRDKGSYVVAGKHIAAYDPFLISSALYPHLRIAWMAKKELFIKPLMAKYIRSTGGFSINREKIDVSSIRSAKNVLKTEHWCLGIFPEGTRQEAGEVGETKKGVGFFAKMCNSDVLPIGLAKEGKKTVITIGKLIKYHDDIDKLNEEVNSDITALTEVSQTHLEAWK